MDTKTFLLGHDQLTPSRLRELATNPGPPVSVQQSTMDRANEFRQLVNNLIAQGHRVYGVNTGFGFLSDVAISQDQLSQLQVNLVRSHACGVGNPIAPELVRALLILRAHTFLLGHSGVRWECIQTILNFLKFDVLPVIPCKGSVGASGDLAPLAHLALGLMGEGKVFYRGEILPTPQVLAALKLSPLKLEAKEGLSLINGTQFMTVIAAFAVDEAISLCRSADIAAALSLDAVRGSKAPFDARIHQVRPHRGQSIVAENIRTLYQGNDEIIESHKDCGKVQDPYSFRCVPQVHGASRGVVDHVREVITTELNSITDNPLVFEDGTTLSGGNFHGQPIAMAMDYLAIGMAELGSISERRIEKITNPHQSGLPPFAAKNSGLNSGFMIPHVVAASLVSENKVLCHPASVDSIPTSADKEDHVSMGPIAARKARKVMHHVSRILAIEFLAAAQGLDLLKPLKPNATLDQILTEIRKLTPSMETDRSLSQEIELLAQWIELKGPENAVSNQGILLQ